MYLPQLLGVGRRLDTVRQVAYDDDVALYIALGVIDPVDGWGSIDWRTVDAALESDAQDWAMGADRDVGRL